MLISGIVLHLCLIFCHNTLIVADDVSAILIEKPHPHSSYLKEVFPFLQKGEKNEDMSALLAEVKREKRVSHHGNFKRTPHIIRLNHGYDQTRRFIRRPFTGFNRFRKLRNRKEKRNVLPENDARYFLRNRKYRELKKEDNMKKPKLVKNSTKSNLMSSKTTIAYITKSSPKSLKTSHTNSKKVQKRTNNKKKYVHPTKRSSNIQRSNLVKNQVLDHAAIGLKPNKVVRSISSTPNQLNQIDEDPSKEFIIRVSDDSDFVEDIKELAKREVKPHHKKNVKSVITKILIIPVERQFEETGDDTPGEIDVVNLKHSKNNNKKRISTKSHKSSSAIISATAKPITSSLISSDTLSALETAQPYIMTITETITEPSTNIDVTIPSTLATIKPTGSKPRKLMVKKKSTTKSSLKSITRNFNLLLTNMPAIIENSVTNPDKIQVTNLIDPT